MRLSIVHPRAVLSALALALLTLQPGCLGCGGGPAPEGGSAPPSPSPAGGPGEPSAIRAQFPERAAQVLEAGEAFVVGDDAFAATGAARGGLAVRLPRQGGDAVRFELPSGFAAEVREDGIAGDGAPEGHAIAYPRAGGTSYWAAIDGGYEEWLLLSPEATARDRAVASWSVAGGVVRQAGEAVEIADGAGTARIRVRAPAAYAAGGRPVVARLSARDGVVELRVDAEGEAVLVDPQWTSTGSMAAARSFFASVLLSTGNVLAASGFNGTTWITASEIWNPATGTWSATNPTANARAAPVWAVLPGNGEVLVAAGFNGSVCESTAELYNPSTGTWSPAGSLSTPRCIAQGALLGSGKFLAAGGQGLSSAEIYDPSTNTWSTANPMSAARENAAAATLQSGNVLVAGGPALATAEVYNPSTNTWTATGAMSAARSYLTLTSLQDGRVLAAGGSSDGTNAIASAEVYSPSTNTWTAVGSMAGARLLHTATLLPGGQVLVAGGLTTPNGPAIAGAELFDPTSNTWSVTASLMTARGIHGAVLFEGGKVLAAGGGSTVNLNVPTTATAEVWGGNGALGAPCSTGTDCASNFCVNGVCCDTACNGGVCNACSVAAGATSNGTCTPLSGTACTDGNACTQTDTCQNGVCVGGNPVMCPPADQCHQPSACNPANGTCSNVPKPNGTACSDGNACTQGDTCQAGVCTSGSPVVCTASDQCHAAGVCNTVTGCPNPAQPDGTACNDGNLCTTMDVCVSGVCTGGTMVTCPVADQCHQPSVCNPANGTCSNVPKPNGSACDDANACTQGETCQAGVCTGGSTVTCTASDQCHTAGVCSPSTGCSNPSKADGTACDDGNACSQVDTCQAGVCTGQSPVVCPTPAPCHNAGVCSPANGTCSNPVAPDGAACNAGNACIQGQTCQAGTCGGGSPVVCPMPDDCHDPGTCDPTNGTCSSPKKPDGTPCKTGVCTAGVCGPASDGGMTGTGGGATSSSTSSSGGTGGGATSSSGAGGGATSSSGGTGGTGVPTSSGGCKCETSSPAPATNGLWAGLGLLVAVRRRRRPSGRRRLDD